MSLLQIATARIYTPYNPYRSPNYDQTKHHIYYKHTLPRNEIEYLLEVVTLQNIPDSMLSYIVSTVVTRYSGLEKLCLASNAIRTDTTSAKNILKDLGNIKQCIHPYGTDHCDDLYNYLYTIAKDSYEEQPEDTWHYAI